MHLDKPRTVMNIMRTLMVGVALLAAQPTGHAQSHEVAREKQDRVLKDVAETVKKQYFQARAGTIHITRQNVRVTVQGEPTCTPHVSIVYQTPRGSQYILGSARVGTLHFDKNGFVTNANEFLQHAIQQFPTLEALMHSMNLPKDVASTLPPDEKIDNARLEELPPLGLPGELGQWEQK